jgi:pilus assembly protein CpaC
MMRRDRRWLGVVLGLVMAGMGLVRPAGAQTVTIAKGTSTVISTPTPIQRIAIGDPGVADASAVSTREVLVTGKGVGNTSLIVWDAADNRRVYNVEVGVDVPALERQLRALFPGEPVTVAGSGNTVILGGRATTGIAARRVQEFVRTTGATTIDNIAAPPSAQVSLRVRFAEVNRSALRQFSLDASAGNVDRLDNDAEWTVENAIGEILRVGVFNEVANLDLVLRALKTNGAVQILAEPNLLALDGQEASFLAGGEFPYTVVTPSAGAALYSVQFKEFGVRLKFLPVVSGNGNIRLKVAPEVSQLDFGTSVQVGGSVLPALRTRRAETAVELRPGQTLAIAGLLDNSLSRNVDKIPVLGDIPILGALFRSTNYRQNRSELIVLVTPQLVVPSDGPIPVPTGEPETWRWDSSLRRGAQVPPARANP